MKMPFENKEKEKNQKSSQGQSKRDFEQTATFSFADNRPESVSQRKMQELSNNSTKVFQFVRKGIPEQDEKNKPGTKEDPKKFYTENGTGPFDSRLEARLAENKEEQAKDPVGSAMKKWSEDKNPFDQSSRIATPDEQTWDYNGTFVWNNVNGYEIKAHVHYTEEKAALPASATSSNTSGDNTSAKKKFNKSKGKVWGSSIGEQGVTPQWVLDMAPDDPMTLTEYKK